MRYTRYVINEVMTINEFKIQMKSRLSLTEKDCLIFECNRRVLNDNMIMKDVYQTHKDLDDKLLYVYYSEIESFG